tara:strand:- start:372 stop:1313 length:942 start_codon:yes stop_codon:yes gene_type:complete
VTQINGQPRIIAMMNQKGGVGKTTSAVSLGAAWAISGQRTLLIDLDPQAHLTMHLGIDPEQVDLTIYDLVTRHDVSARDVVQKINDQLYVLPGHVNLAGLDAELAPKMVTGVAQKILKERCGSLIWGTPEAQGGPNEEPFDYVMIDCPPSLGLATINALILAQEVIVPMQPHFLALQGLSKLLETVRLIGQSFNPDLSVSGILICMPEPQTLLAQEVISDLASFLTQSQEDGTPWCNAQILKPVVRRNIKLAECPSFGKTIFDYEPNCHGADDYQQLAAAIMAQCPRELLKSSDGKPQVSVISKPVAQRVHSV